MDVNFSTNAADMATIFEIVERAKLLKIYTGKEHMAAVMDVTACHCNGCPLKLQELAAADDFNFTHDVAGIKRHIDRETGQLRDMFRPRFAGTSDKPAHLAVPHHLYLALGQNYWERRDTADEAIKAMKKRLSGGGRTPAQYRLGIYQVGPETRIDEMGRFVYPATGPEPLLVRYVQVTKSNGAVKDLPLDSLK